MSPHDPYLLKDKVAVITGVGRGIGRDIALAFASAGAAVACSAALNRLFAGKNVASNSFAFHRNPRSPECRNSTSLYI